MIDATYSWLVTHPLSGELIVGLIVGVVILFLTPVLAPIVDTFWKFCAIRPQRLNIWVLKARLSSAEWEIHRVRRMSKELSYFMYTCFMGLGYMGFALAFLILIAGLLIKMDAHEAVHDAQTWMYRLPQVLQLALMFLTCACLFRFISTAYRLYRAAVDPASSLNELAVKVEMLGKKLGLNTPIGEGPAHEEP